MNIEETKKAIEVMQAFVNGKVVLDYSNLPVGDPTWNWCGVASNYRIKPQPKEIWVNEYADGEVWAHKTAADAGICARGGGAERLAVHYREVIE